MIQIPKKLLRSKYRREMWENVVKLFKKLDKVLSISEAYILGSFTTRKSRPADVDFILLMKVRDKKSKAKWSIDFVMAPDNHYGQFVLKDADDWVKEKYGLKNSARIRVK